MNELPKTGTPTLIKPRPNRHVLKEGGSQPVPPGGAVFPWSHHWQVMVGSGAIEYRECPPWETEVLVREKGAEYQRTKWTPEVCQQVLNGKLEFARPTEAPTEKEGA